MDGYDDELQGKERARANEKDAERPSTATETANAPTQPPVAVDKAEESARAARSKPGPLAPPELQLQGADGAAIPACPPVSGAKGARRWTASSAPLALRTPRADAGPALSAVATRLGGSICTLPSPYAVPDLLLEVPIGRWSELRDALAARAASTPDLSAPPEQGYDLVRVVVRPR